MMFDVIGGIVAFLLMIAAAWKMGERKGAKARDEKAQKAAEERKVARDEIDDTASAGDAVQRLRDEWSRNN